MDQLKTTVEISDSLLREVRKVAMREGVTMRALLERELRRALEESEQGKPFKLQRATFKGKGRQADFADADWSSVRDAVYKGRGA